MHCHRILVSALFVDMSSLLTSFISKKYFYFHLFPLVLYTFRYIFFNVALVVVAAVAVVEAAVGNVELQRERETHCQQCRASEKLTAKCRKK